VKNDLMRKIAFIFILIQPWVFKAQSDLTSKFFDSRNKGDFMAMDSIGDLIYKRKDIFDTIPYQIYFFRDLTATPNHENNGKWLWRYYNFVNEDYENINLIGEVNWLLGNFYFNQNELKRAKEFYSIALDFYKKNQNISYLEKVEFYLALSNINLFDNEALLKNAEAIANNNNDSLLHCRILIQRSGCYIQKEEYLLGENNMDELLLYLNEFESDSFYKRYYEFQANLNKAIFRLKLNKDIQLQKIYLLKNISILNELMDFNFFEYNDELWLVINILNPIDPICATLIHDGRDYCERILSNNPYKSLCFGLIEAGYLMSLNKLDQAIELCKTQIELAQKYFFQDLEEEYNSYIIKIYELQGNSLEYSKKSKFLKFKETENGGFQVTHTSLSIQELYKLKRESETEKLKYIDFVISQHSFNYQAKMPLSWVKRNKREVAFLIGKDNVSYALLLKNLALTYVTLNKTKKALRSMLKSYKIDQKNYIESDQKDQSKEYLIWILLKNRKFGIVDTMLNSITINKTAYLNKAFFSFNPLDLISEKENFDGFYFFLSSYISYRKLLPNKINIIHNYWVSLNGISNSKGEWFLNELKNDKNYELEYHKINSLRKQLNSIDLNNPTISWNNKMINDSLENIQKNIEIDFLKKHLLIPKEKKKLDFEYDFFIDISKIYKCNYNTNLWTDTSQYIVFISDSKDSLVDYVFLENGSEIDDNLYYSYQNEATNYENMTNLQSPYFYNSFWKPIADKIGDAKTIYVSLGGVYNNINLNTLYNPETGKYLIEEKDIRIVKSARDFVLSKEQEKKIYTTNTASLFGFPNFDRNTTFSTESLFVFPINDGNNNRYADSKDLFASMRDLNSFWLDSLTRGGLKADPLPATKIEVENISLTLKSKGWQVNSYLAENASETNIKKQESPRILHIATHGYFFPDIPIDKDNTRFLGMDRQQVVQDPMLRSGLLFTGANRTLKGEESKGENGLLSAAEASLLDLRETELVVLSACETGKGEVKNSEGVYGLRKAFSDAGAQNIIMSLWKVDDKVTQEFMSRFYEIWLNDKTSIREAFSKTQLEIKAKYPQPYYWGAFILVGE
jgi:CHAT domain-containing protein